MSQATVNQFGGIVASQSFRVEGDVTYWMQKLPSARSSRRGVLQSQGSK